MSEKLSSIKLYTRSEVAQRYGVALRTLDRWTRDGSLACIRHGRTVRFTQAHLEAFDALRYEREVPRWGRRSSPRWGTP